MSYYFDLAISQAVRQEILAVINKAEENKENRSALILLPNVVVVFVGGYPVTMKKRCRIISTIKKANT